jgi:bacterioferritin-associated ferredoxin
LKIRSKLRVCAKCGRCKRQFYAIMIAARTYAPARLLFAWRQP